MKYYISTNEKRRNKNGLLQVMILFKDGNKRFYVNTGIYSSVKVEGREIPKTEKNSKAKTNALNRILLKVEEYLLDNKDLPYEQKKEELRAIIGEQPKKSKCFVDFVLKFAETKGNKGTKKLYEFTAKKILEYDSSAVFETITADWLVGFEKHFTQRKDKPMSVNGFAIHLRNIRTVFNWCIDNEYTDKYPFRGYKIKSEKVPIRNLTAGQMVLLRDYEVEPWQEIYRDFFMLSFYLCGINPVDLLHLKSANIANGRLTYKRRKTGHLFNLPVPQEAQEIINNYRGKDWLLSPLDKYLDYKDFLHRWNDALKKIGSKDVVPDKTGKRRKIVYKPLFPTLTVYSARYSFASIGAELDIPRETIALCLGHSWADVTSHYIAYDTKKIDKAVRRIIDYLNGFNVK